jgi:hypothetical protein
MGMSAIGMAASARPKRLVKSGNGLIEFQYECANCKAKKTVSELDPTRADVRYWPKADIPNCTAHVRFRG